MCYIIHYQGHICHSLIASLLLVTCCSVFVQAGELWNSTYMWRVEEAREALNMTHGRSIAAAVHGKL